VLLRFYSRNRILSEEAKVHYVEPNLLPLSVITFDSNPDNLVVFDVDGTLIQSLGIDDRCFTQSVSDILGVEEISTDWGSYKHQTDAGLIFEIASNHFGSPPSDRLVKQVRERFIHLLSLNLNDEFTLPEVRGAGALLDVLRHDPNWCAAIATGGWERPAILKLCHAGIQVDDIPFASSDDAVARKEILECAIQRALKHYRKERFRKIVYVGDGSWDAHAASQLGIGFIGVTTNPAASVFDIDHTFVVRDFADPQEFIRLLDSAHPHEGR
jgi:phosphoglycolate phosphatase-like HAD superfamily hydrolase